MSRRVKLFGVVLGVSILFTGCAVTFHSGTPIAEVLIDEATKDIDSYQISKGYPCWNANNKE